MKKRDDDAEEETQMERQRRRARERRLAAEATAAPAPAAQPPPIPLPYIPPPPKLKKVGASPLAKRRIELSTRWRRCDVTGCAVLTDGMSSLCRRHKENRARYGHAKVRSRLRQKDYLHLIKATLTYFRTSPPPPPILESVQSFLTPPGRLAAGEVGRKARSMLIAEMARWQDPRYRKRTTRRPGHRGAGYTPHDYLAVMVAVEAYIAERDGHGWPGESEQLEKAFALVKPHIRPGRHAVSPKRQRESAPGIVKTDVKYSQDVSGTVLRAIAARLRQFNTLGVYIYKTAKAVLAMQGAARKPLRKQYVTPVRAVPAPPPAPAPPPPKLTRQVKITLPPRYRKPTIGRLCTTAELRAWERNEHLWRQCPEGHYYQTEEIHE